jgi:hypothetical protein
VSDLLSEANEENEVSPGPAEPRPVVLRRRLPFVVNWPVMIVVLALVALAAGLVLLNLNLLPEPILAWWPLVVLIPATLWFLTALARRKPRRLLRSTALLGLATSLLLITQHIAPSGATPIGTMLGVTLIVVGAGLLLRGLLLSQQPIS